MAAWTRKNGKNDATNPTRSRIGAARSKIYRPLRRHSGLPKQRGAASKGLVIAEPWIGMIVAGEKTWEMRSRDTAVRGRIALIRKGSKTIVGVADLVGTVLNLSLSDLKAGMEEHRVSVREIGGRFKHTTAWVLERARPLHDPIPYRHPAGAIIWVNLDPEISAKIQQQISPTSPIRPCVLRFSQSK